MAKHYPVLVVEDHPLYRRALLEVVREVGGNSATIVAGSAEEGLLSTRTVEHLRLIVLDLGLPGLSGIEAVSTYRQARSDVPMVVVSACDDRRNAAAAIRAGAQAFISKAARTEDLRDALTRALDGRMSGQEWVGARGPARALPAHMPSQLGLPLTARQSEALSLLLRGHSNKEIGLQMGLAEITVKVHLSAIFRALGVVNRTQAVLAARRLGLETALPGNPGGARH